MEQALDAWITAEEERAENGKVWYKQSRWRKNTKRGATTPLNEKQQKKKRRHAQCDKKRKAILTIQGRKGQMKQGRTLNEQTAQGRRKGQHPTQ